MKIKIDTSLLTIKNGFELNPFTAFTIIDYWHSEALFSLSIYILIITSRHFAPVRKTPSNMFVFKRQEFLEILNEQNIKTFKEIPLNFKLLDQVD